MVAGKQHPHPDRLLEFVEKQVPVIGLDYVIRSAKFVEREYPGSAEYLVPKLRAIYRKHSRIANIK